VPTPLVIASDAGGHEIHIVAPASQPSRNLEAESAVKSTDEEAYIPGGTYTIGPYDMCDKFNKEKGIIEGWGPDCPNGYFAAKQVTLKAYYLDRTEVTLADYDKCVKAKACPKITRKMMHENPTGCARDEAMARRLQDGPISCIVHAEAETFCAWKGKRLPTDAEWEVAGRGGDSRRFPWGDDFPADEPSQRKRVCESYQPCPVKKFGPYGPFRLYGMESGVGEWTSSPACESYPKDCSQTAFGVKGGSYIDYKPMAWAMLTVGGVEGSWRYSEVGFRCARDAS
jgi:iron(II)-dependent oxidoreductase